MEGSGEGELRKKKLEEQMTFDHRLRRKVKFLIVSIIFLSLIVLSLALIIIYLTQESGYKSQFMLKIKSVEYEYGIPDVGNCYNGNISYFRVTVENQGEAIDTGEVTTISFCDNIKRWRVPNALVASCKNEIKYEICCVKCKQNYIESGENFSALLLFNFGSQSKNETEEIYSLCGKSYPIKMVDVTKMFDVLDQASLFFSCRVS
jgi:hypothetical protein